ncbi:MAG: serine/threonine-protein kinase [Candidatus Krumholzibacteria bacterium]|nr:serine/threonine-protein kinase [Candidatus Krumholzibacteria bacterium]
MNLESGTLLRQYKILQAIGAGGMGEVYRALDTNLEREVAVKVLPPSVAENVTSLARLEREAKAIAALSHPNILAVYDFGTEGGTAFLVTELLEGETLRERLEKGAIPPRKATDIGRQIARGLAAAHDKGIVHRDLKPENIFLTGGGRVKILDFGLATAASGDGETDNADLSKITNITVPGTVLGTVNYMSPEQVRGQTTDNRSDLFSFGSVLYEMIASARPFQQETAAETMTAILKEEPAELATLVVDLPPAVIAIIRRCLEKEPSERFHSAHDLAFSLEALSGSAVSTGTAAALTDVAGPRRRPQPVTVALLVLLGMLIGATATWFLRPAAEPPEVARYTNLSSRRGIVTNARFTGSDGSAIYSATWDGEPVQLFPASPGNITSGPLNIGTAHLYSISTEGELALSLDRRFTLGFETLGTLAVAQAGGAAPRAILEDVMAADWAPDGRTMAVAHQVDGVVRLEYPIGTVIYESPGWIGIVRVSHDGEQIAFTDCPIRGDNVSTTRVIDRNGTIADLDILGSWGLAWSPDGQYVYGTHGPNLSRQRVGHEAQLISEFPASINLLDIDDTGRFLISAGTMRRETYVQSLNSAEMNLSWRAWSTPRYLSADGSLVIFEEGNEFNDDGYAIYQRNTDGSAPQQLAYGVTMAVAPDLQRVAVYQRPFQDDGELLILPTGAGKIVKLPLGGLQLTYDDGNWVTAAGDNGNEGLLLTAALGDEAPRLYFLPLDGTAAHPVTPPEMSLAHNGHLVSGDGQRIIVKPAKEAPVEFALDGAGPSPLPGFESSDLPLRFDQDGTHVYVQRMNTLPAQIFRIALGTGERVLWRELSPADPAGITAVDRVQISADGSIQVYSNRRQLVALEIIEGLR